MTQHSSNLITLTIAPISADINPQPAGGWDSWVPPVNFQAPYPIQTGAAIYKLTAAEITRLRSAGLITDESLVFYKMRIANTALAKTSSSDTYSLGIPSGRTFRALAALAQLGMISRFSLEQFQLSWIKIAAALTEAEIRNKWKKKIEDSHEK